MRINGRQVVAVATAATCLAAATACSGGSAGKSSDSRSSSSTPKSAATVASDFSKPVANDIALRKNVTQSSCERRSTTSSASGTATNPTTAALTYHLTVYFTTTKGTDLAKATTDVRVPAKGTAKWSASKTFGYKSAVRCVLVGVAKSSG